LQKPFFCGRLPYYEIKPPQCSIVAGRVQESPDGLHYQIVSYKDFDGELHETDNPTDAQLAEADVVHVGWEDPDTNWHYRWIYGPFDEEFYIWEAIEGYGVEQ